MVLLFNVTNTTSDQIDVDRLKVPSFVESGYPDIDVAVWLELFVSAKMPPTTVAALNAELHKIVSLSDIREHFAKWGGVPVGGSPESFQGFISVNGTSFMVAHPRTPAPVH